MNKEQELRPLDAEALAKADLAACDRYADLTGDVMPHSMGQAVRTAIRTYIAARRSSDEQAEVVAWMVVDWDKAYGPAGMRYLTRSEAEGKPEDWEPGEYEAFKQAMRSAIPLYRTPPAVAAGGVTEAMVTRAMDRAGWTTKPTPPEYETCNGALIDLGISQDEADHINAQLREEMREILTAALAVGDEGIREGAK